MCHCIAFDRPDFLAAVQRYKLSQSWLFTCREREEAQFNIEKRQVHERLVQAQMQIHIKRHLGRLFPPGARARIIMGMEIPEVLLRGTFESWSQITKENRHRRKKNEILKVATKGGLPVLSILTCQSIACPNTRKSAGFEAESSILAAKTVVSPTRMVFSIAKSAILVADMDSCFST